MLLTLFLLGLLYVALIGALLVAGTGIVLLVVIMGGLSFAQLFFSDSSRWPRWARRRSRRNRRRGCTR